MKTTKITTDKENFLKGFALTMEATQAEAEHAWDYYCDAMELSPWEIRKNESGGFKAGMEMAFEIEDYLK